MDRHRIVYFGDSLTENGTVFAITGQILPVAFPLASAGYAGVFSNGPVYSQIVPDLLGVPVVENFAVGGARALGSREITALGGGALGELALPGADPALVNFEIDFGAQVARFLGHEALDPFAGTTTASILIGLNDLASFEPSGIGDPAQEAAELVAGVAGATIGAAALLGTAGGVDEVVLYTYPDAGFFPFSRFLDPSLLPLAEQVFSAHAQALEAGALALEVRGIDTEVVSLGQISDEIAADPLTFGFLGMGPVLVGSAANPQMAPDGTLFFPENPAVAGLDPDQVAFYDFLHPTTALHGVWAAYSAAVLTEETQFLDDGRNVAFGTRDDDFVLAKAGSDTLLLRSGDDTAFAGLGDDRAFGQSGGDIISGGDGDDHLFGGRGSDVLAGNVGDDFLFGGRDADALVDGLGSDRAYGGHGTDVFFYTDAALIGGVTGQDRDVFVGGHGHDLLVLAVAGETHAAVKATIEDGGGRSGRFEFDPLGLTLSGIEEILLVDERTDLAGAAALPDGLDRLVAEADLWGLL